MIRAVIFDMDGVLSDTERLHVQSEERQLSRLGIDPGVLAGGTYMGVSDREFFTAVFREHGVVADVDAIDEKQHVLGDIGGVVGDALEIVGYEHQVDGGGNGGGIRLHELGQLLVDGVFQIVHRIVGSQDAADSNRRGGLR